MGVMSCNTKEVAATESEGRGRFEGRQIENWVRTWDGSDNGDFFGDLFTLKVLLRKRKTLHNQDRNSLTTFSI